MILGYTKLPDDTPVELIGVETDSKTYHLIVEATLPNGTKVTGRYDDDWEMLEMFSSITKFKYICVGTDNSVSCPVASIEKSAFDIMNGSLDELVILHPNSYYGISSIANVFRDVTRRCL